jgi:hypothetical protein
MAKTSTLIAGLSRSPLRTDGCVVFEDKHQAAALCSVHPDGSAFSCPRKDLRYRVDLKGVGVWSRDELERIPLNAAWQ